MLSIHATLFLTLPHRDVLALLSFRLYRNCHFSSPVASPRGDGYPLLDYPKVLQKTALVCRLCLSHRQLASATLVKPSALVCRGYSLLLAVLRVGDACRRKSGRRGCRGPLPRTPPRHQRLLESRTRSAVSRMWRFLSAAEISWVREQEPSDEEID
jgi:hypothetical protein